jgi:hypothetical protein
VDFVKKMNDKEKFYRQEIYEFLDSHEVYSYCCDFQDTNIYSVIQFLECLLEQDDIADSDLESYFDACRKECRYMLCE